jgi:hypothetical protein
MTVHAVTAVQGVVPSDVAVRLLSPGTLVVDLGDRRSSARAQIIDAPDDVIEVLSTALLAAPQLARDSASHTDDLVAVSHLVQHTGQRSDTPALLVASPRVGR